MSTPDFSVDSDAITIEGDPAQTALKKALHEAEQSEARLRKIIDTIPALVWCGRSDGSKEFFNKRWCDYTGLCPEEVEGWGWKKAIHPDDLDNLLDKAFKVLKAGGSGEIEVRMRRFDGEYRWFLFRAEPLRDENGNIVNWYGTNIDIQDRKQIEEKLRQDEIELRQLIDVIPQTIMVLDPDGTPVYANQSLLDYTGFTPEAVKAPDFRKRFFHPEDVERLREERSVALSKGLPFENEWRVRHRDGQFRWSLIQYRPLKDEQGQIIR